MTLEQTILFLIIAATMGLFIWGRLRYDIVAVVALLVAVYCGVVSAEDAFRGFGHPAVITVAAVFIVSRALQISGLVDLLVSVLAPANRNMTLQVGAIGGLAMAFSAFMNNIGALALMLPVALRQSLAILRDLAGGVDHADRNAAQHHHRGLSHGRRGRTFRHV